MTEPTDDEIKDLYAEQTGFILDDSPAALLDFAREVLALWGQPDGEHTNAELQQMLDESFDEKKKCYFTIKQQQTAIDNLIAERDALKAAHSGEPVGYLYCGGSYGDELADWEIVAEQLQCDRLNEHHGALGKEAKLPLYTAPQPVERAPLTQAQVIEAFCALPHQVQFVTAFDQGVRFAEKHHGIKGGGDGKN